MWNNNCPTEFYRNKVFPYFFQFQFGNVINSSEIKSFILFFSILFAKRVEISRVITEIILNFDIYQYFNSIIIELYYLFIG